ncbi:uncharacterized protein BDR25DRAFT_26767 [Lindgomyces ingoldianus]|uniref:Uncharacterized protein n=1 Tax=Lindgomyces ingoldianus TaxID=673940 RepID=A0ACB6QXT8_9PLEO|nr:uncharacterized protein BDR25DRAFT_26767 [Lindgomyces ingoldianus]KAF2471383.1 hypothetical protein BDR25DRAFT_26767 [Lindgomyces ingoldianus]
MDEEDYVMEDSVVNSTEVNGNRPESTVDPTMITLHAKKDRLPILSHTEPVRGSSRLAFPNESLEHPFALGAASAGLSSDSLQDSSSDEMDLTSPTPSNVQVRIPPPPTYPPLRYSSSKTGVVYDPRMRFHSEPDDMISRPDDIHPEDPRRIYEIFQELQQAGLVPGDDESEEDTDPHQCWRIEARPAIRGEICLIHTPKHYEFIRGLSDKTLAELIALGHEHDSIYFNESTFACAKLAVGGAIEACRAVVRGDVRNAIAIIRPPGHHAESEAPSGFCIFNNVPIAARVCQKDFPDKCRKVLILDWDVHHGNGVQHAFYEDPNVLYISLHVFKNGTFYPNLPDADYDYCGEGQGVGRNVNIPWEDHGMGDAEYMYAFQQVVMPVATEFDPDLVLVSAGFDAAEGDVLGGCHVTPACYGHMTHMLMSLAEGKIAVCLEGGYNLRSIARSALAVTRTLMLQPPDRLDEDIGSPNDSCVRTIELVKREQSKHWKCFYPKYLNKHDPSFFATQRLHEVIREWQSKVLGDEHQMTPLAIRRPLIAETFEHNVIATPQFMERRPLLVIFHDPPEFMNLADAVTGKTDLHNSWLTDVVKSYIDWAIKNDFEVIDVNIPKVVAIEDDDGGYIRADSKEVRVSQTRELAGYLWENYIEPNDATQVFLMGVGPAYLGLLDLLSNSENCTEADSVIQCLIGFVADTVIQSIKRATDDNIASWYYNHSLVFVASTHHVWEPTRQRKIRKKYGKLKKSQCNNLNEMLVEHQDEVKEYLLRKKSEFEESEMETKLADDIRSGLRSPPLPSGSNTPRPNNVEARPGSVPASLRSPKMPQVGYFTVSNSPRSPRSPMKRTF